MPLAMVGVSHRTAPVEVRERFAFPGGDAARGLAALRERGIEEAVLLSTCNRTEIYVHPSPDGAAERAVAGLLAERAGTLPLPAARYLYLRRGEEVAPHLFRVAAGLDSMVLGEAEVQGQVREAYLRSAEHMDPPMTGAVLNRLFQTGLAVGGRVRAETSLGEGSASVASVAVDLARKIFGNLAGRRVLVLGAGDTAEQVVAALARHGVEGIVVANRTYDRAVHLAERLRGRAVQLGEITRALAEADIVLTSTAAPHPLITRDTLAEAHPEGMGRTLLVVDIAIPRDVAPEVGELQDVFLYNVDDLQRILDETLDRRRDAAVAAEALVAREASAFEDWRRALEVVPAIRALRERAEALRAREVEALLAGMPGLGPEERRAVEAFSRRLLNQLLHGPTARLREAGAAGRGSQVLEAARLLWGPGAQEAGGPGAGLDPHGDDKGDGGS